MNQNLNENQETSAKSFFDTVMFLNAVLKYKWHILIVTIIAAIFGVIFSSSFFITPLYLSEAVAYPSNISTFSQENETEQMVQLLGSSSIKGAIIDKYDLWNRYKIKPESRYAKWRMMKKYKKNIYFTKTSFDAIIISVMDRDPDTAALIANDILHLYDELSNKLHKEKYVETSTMLRDQLVRKQHDIDSMKSRLTELSQKYGLLDYYAQSREVSRSYLSGSSKGKELQTNMQLYGAEMIELQEKIKYESERYVDVKKDYEIEYRYTVSNRTYYTLVEPPYPNDKKKYPVRWMIASICALGALCLSIMVAFVVERRKNE